MGLDWVFANPCRCGRSWRPWRLGGDLFLRPRAKNDLDYDSQNHYKEGTPSPRSAAHDRLSLCRSHRPRHRGAGPRRRVDRAGDRPHHRGRAMLCALPGRDPRPHRGDRPAASRRVGPGALPPRVQRHTTIGSRSPAARSGTSRGGAQNSEPMKCSSSMLSFMMTWSEPRVRPMPGPKLYSIPPANSPRSTGKM
jgi:hypothetical protein